MPDAKWYSGKIVLGIDCNGTCLRIVYPFNYVNMNTFPKLAPGENGN
jgi:hypothetical protein